MANNYKTDQITLNAANTDFTILTASASTTLVKNITWIHEGHNTSVKLSLTKSGGSKTVIGIFAATSNTSTKIWTDILPLEAGDVLHLQSDHISSSDVGFCVISYVINTSSVSGQSIGVLTDVDLTGNASGKILAYNGNQFAPIANSSPSDTDSLTEGSSNLYFTDARVAANSAVAANTAKVSGIANVNADTAPQLGGTLDVNGKELQSNSDFIVRVDADNNTSNSKFVVKNGAGNEAFSVNEEGTNISITGADNNIKIGNLDGGLGSFNGISLNNNLTYPGIVGFAGGSNSNDNFFCFGVVLDFRPDGVAGGLRMIKDSSGNAMVTINKGDSSSAPTTHTLYVGGNGKFDDNVDFAQGIDVTGNISVSGTVDGIDVGVDVAANTAKVGITSAQALAITANSSKIEEVEEDTSPTLGGDLDTLTQQIKTSTTNGNVILNPNGTGFLEIKGNQGGGSADNPGAIRLNCAANTHGVTIKSPAHSAAATYTLVLPTTAGGANQVLKTNGSGVLSWVSQSASGANYATNELITGSNTVMESSSTTSNKIADVVGAAVASRDNANAKKLLGFHTGSGNYVLRGMVDAVSPINGSAAGSPLWLGASGVFDSAPPTTANHYSRIVGYFIGTGQSSEVLCYFDPSQDWVQIDS
ncbi:hypothetical protein OAF30_03000 [Flavobacteriales bacterium]|nr:hypothetical protein [Flavobacteriales bacterium]